MCLTNTHTHTSKNGILRHGFDIILECLTSPCKLCFTEGNSVVVVVVVVDVVVLVDVVVAVEDMVIIFFTFSHTHTHMHTHNKNSYFLFFLAAILLLLRLSYFFLLLTHINCCDRIFSISIFNFTVMKKVLRIEWGLNLGPVKQ